MTRIRLLLTTAALAASLGTAPIARAQEANLARIVVIKPKPGQNAEFEAGYKRHLEWHRRNQDPWQWYGWTFVLGERLGQFMDGTFGHTAAGFDSAIKPAEDGADNAINVTPYADFVSHGVYERLDALSRGTPLPDTSPFLVLNTYHVVHGQESAFERAWQRVSSKANIERATWYKLRLGGTGSQYILMRPATSFGAAAALPALEFPAGIIERSTTELLRYQPALSYIP